MRGAVPPTHVLACLVYERIFLLYLERKEEYEGVGFGGRMLLRWIFQD
jgi:hypothetical protein